MDLLLQQSHCEGIQCSVVLYEVESAILLLDEEYQRCHG